MKQILVTGGTGYIGSHTVVELLNAGFSVSILDDLSNSNADVIEAIEKITGKRPSFTELDICDYNALDVYLSKNQFDAIIHFAASILVDESVQKPLHYYKNNLLSLINVLESAAKYNIDKVVFSSSCSVYGEPDSLPVNESASVKKAESPYANTKQIGEEIIEDTIKSSSLKAISLRYFNPIGAHDTALIGEHPVGPPSHLITIITRYVSEKKTINVYGNDYNTPDGTCIRDYIHVVDVAKAHVIATERLLNGKNKSSFEVFNLGTGTGHSVLEAIHTFEKATGEKCNYKIVSKRPGDVEKVYADTSKANKELGWKAEKTFEEAIQSAWKWEQRIRN
jgi:UDP-glucose 4-epimerase